MTMPLRAEPRIDPALAVELTERERIALMTASDWAWLLDKLAYESGVDS